MGSTSYPSLTSEESLPRVLVVDDDAGIRRFAARILARSGYEVVTASDGPDAIRLVEAQRRFDLFVIDVMMPGMRGDELARRLHDRDPDIKVLYFTGYADQFFAARSVLRDNESVLEKPVTGSAFLEAVSRPLFGHGRGPAGGPESSGVESEGLDRPS
jgi:two-component system cell cycle sensor histidine kinase/response regulator CckA